MNDDSVLGPYIIVYKNASDLTLSEKLTGLQRVLSHRTFCVELLLTQLKAGLLLQYHGVVQFVPIFCLSQP